METPRGSLFADLLTQEHVAIVRQAMTRRLRDPQLAEDAAQDVFEAVGNSIERFDPSRGSFEGWLLGFVEYVARATWRRQLALPEPRGELPPTPWEDTPRGPLPARVLDAINALRPRDRRLLVLRVVEQWPAAAVGEELGMTETNVNTTAKRVLDRLSRRIDPADLCH
ncbi:MAG: RNA polymerase sigma factor [Thermoleophilia bacterium]